MTGWTAAMLIFIGQPGGFFIREHFWKNFPEIEQLGFQRQPRQSDVKRGIDNNRTCDHPQTKGENDHQQGTNNREHHQSKQRDGESVNERPLPNVPIDLVALHYTTMPMRYVKMPTTAPAISTKTKTLVIPFLRSAFSPKKCPALKRKPTRKMTPRMIGKTVLIVSAMSATEFSIPPICAKVGIEKSINKAEV